MWEIPLKLYFLYRHIVYKAFLWQDNRLKHTLTCGGGLLSESNSLEEKCCREKLNSQQELLSQKRILRLVSALLSHCYTVLL